MSNGESISEQAVVELRRTREAKAELCVSPITAWEIGLLVSRGRVSLLMSPQRWFDRLLEAPGVTLSAMPPAVLIASSLLPGEPPADPADRILAATAREYGYTLVTRDRPLLGYAKQGHIQAIAC